MASIDIAPGRHREHTTTQSARSKAYLAGVVFVALVAAGFLIGGSSPDENASAQKVISFYGDHKAVTIIGTVLVAIAVPFAVIFGAAVRQALGRVGGAASRWGDVALVGSGIAGVGLLFAAVTSFALLDGSDNHAAGATMLALNGLSAESWLMFVPGFGVLGIGVGGGILASNVISRWAGWLALALGVLCFVPYASFFAFVLAVVWIPIVSVKLSSATA